VLGLVTGKSLFNIYSLFANTENKTLSN